MIVASGNFFQKNESKLRRGRLWTCHGRSRFLIPFVVGDSTAMPKKTIHIIVIALCLLTSQYGFPSTGQQSPGLKIGDPAPKIDLARILQSPSPDAVSPEKLKGQIVILEFWATWCAPCIPALKHMNELADEFKDKPIQFISVTDENESKIGQFLKKTPIRGMVGLDFDNSLQAAYHVIGIPHTVIIDQQGKIAGITYPENLTTAVLNDLLTGKHPSVPLKAGLAADTDWDKSSIADGILPLFQVVIKPSTAITGKMVQDDNKITADGISIFAAVSTAYQTPSFRIVDNLPETKDKYRMSVIVPPGREKSLHQIFQRALETTFGIRVHKETREMDVYVLRVPTGGTAKMRASQLRNGSVNFGRGHMRAEKQSMKLFTEQLENIFGRAVVDETGLKEEYDWDLPYDFANRDALINIIKEQLGLEMIRSKRSIEVLVIDKLT